MCHHGDSPADAAGVTGAPSPPQRCLKSLFKFNTVWCLKIFLVTTGSILGGFTLIPV